MAGWILLHRQIRNHWIFKRADYLKAWLTILLTVNYEDKTVLVDGELMPCKRGQSLNSLLTWAKEFGKGWTVQRVRTFFNLLKNDSMITLEGLRKTTRLTVCNYDDYQNDQHTDNMQINTQNNTQTTRKTTQQNDSESIIYKDGQHTDNTQNNTQTTHRLYTTKRNNIKNNNNTKEACFDFSQKIWFEDSELNSLFIDFLKVREKIKAVNSERAINTLVKTLRNLTTIKADAIAIIEQSIKNSWKDLYQLKSQNNGQKN